jgi:hypothetical protein
MLKTIEPNANFAEDQLQTQKKFNLAGQAMNSLFIGNLVKFNAGTIQKIRLELFENLPDKSNIPNPKTEEIKELVLIRKRINEGTYYYHNYIDYLIDVVIYYRRFNFSEWLNAGKFAKKEFIVQEIYDSMLYLANHYSWERPPIHHAYNACVQANFENNWYIKKFTKTLPKRKYTGNVWVEYDIDSFRTFLVIKDKQDYIIQKKLIHTLDYEDENVNPLFDTDLIFKGSVKWEGSVFSLFSSKGTLLGSLNLADENVSKLKVYTPVNEIITTAAEPVAVYEKD